MIRSSENRRGNRKRIWMKNLYRTFQERERTITELERREMKEERGRGEGREGKEGRERERPEEIERSARFF